MTTAAPAPPPISAPSQYGFPRVPPTGEYSVVPGGTASFSGTSNGLQYYGNLAGNRAGNRLHCVATGCTALQVALRCNRLHCVATGCTALQQAALRCRLHCVATGCTALQQVALRCNRLHCVATRCDALAGSPGWFLSRVEIDHVRTADRWIFPCEVRRRMQHAASNIHPVARSNATRRSIPARGTCLHCTHAFELMGAHGEKDPGKGSAVPAGPNRGPCCTLYVVVVASLRCALFAAAAQRDRRVSRGQCVVCMRRMSCAHIVCGIPSAKCGRQTR
jgi:hypothetical protein